MIQLNTSFFALGRQLGWSVADALTLHWSVAALVAILVATLWHRSPEWRLRSAGLTVGTLLATPYLIHYDLVWSLLPIAWLAAHASAHGWRLGDRIWIGLIWLLPQVQLPLLYLLHWQPTPVLLLGLLLWIVHRAGLGGSRSSSPPLDDADARPQTGRH